MEQAEILKELNNLFKDVFQNPSINITEATNSSDIDEWDSLNHAQLISAIEKHFRIKFKLSEMLNFKNAGKICEAISKKTVQS